ncbi:hypothetical protein D5086_008453 [Populus alba]|uniref:Uncharacterized protein n=1 Tax=Populus alba TaxID=43335 RepID=A0ACC4CG49_POPAL
MEKMKRNVSEKMMLKKQIKNKKGDDKKNRFLVSVSFLGSAGPIRFVVNGDDLVSGVIDTALKTVESTGANRFPRGKEFCAVQETAATTDDRNEIRHGSKKTIWVEGIEDCISSHMGIGWREFHLTSLLFRCFSGAYTRDNINML